MSELMKAMTGSREEEEQRIVVVSGMGGCGKTTLVRKYINEHLDRYETVFFINGSSEARLRASITRHVQALGIEHSQMSFDDAMLFLSQSITGERLIIFDNVDDPNLDLNPFLPVCDSVSIIITTRNPDFSQLTSNGHIGLDVMSSDEAVDVITRLSGREDKREDVLSITEELGRHPIALVQAGSYLKQNHISGKDYLDRLREDRRKMMERGAINQRGMRYASAYAAFDASYTALSLPAQQLLQLLSFCHWASFPTVAFQSAAKEGFAYKLEDSPESDDQNDFELGITFLTGIFCRNAKWTNSEMDSMISTLRNYSFITVIPTTDSLLLNMHPLTHEWARSRVGEETVPRYRAATVRLLACGAIYEAGIINQYLAAHINHFIAGNVISVTDSAAFADVLQKAGFYDGASKFANQVLDAVESRPEAARSQLIAATTRLAHIYRLMGKYSEAEVLYGQVLETLKKDSKLDDPEVINAMNNLALTYRDLGKFNDAVVLQLEVLRLRRQSSEKGVETISAMHDLAFTYQHLGRFSEAEELQSQVLALRREMLSDRHPDTIAAMQNLAITLRSLKRLTEAETLQAEVLNWRRDVLSERHPDTIDAMLHLGVTYERLKRHEEAEVLLSKVVKLRTEILCERHPGTLLAMYNLANQYWHLGRASEAEQLQEKVLRLRREELGDRHPDTIRIMNNLAFVYQARGHHIGARGLLSEALEAGKEAFPEKHPVLLEAMDNLATSLAELGDKSASDGLRVRIRELKGEPAVSPPLTEKKQRFEDGMGDSPSIPRVRVSSYLPQNISSLRRAILLLVMVVLLLILPPLVKRVMTSIYS